MITTFPESTRVEAVARSAPPTSAIVRAEGLTKAFPVRRSWGELLRRPWERAARVTVVEQVSFEVHSGEFFGLLGANGAGKTTLFRMLAAQLIPDGGAAWVDGCDVIRNPRGVHSRLTPVGTDERSLNWRLTARENLELFAVLYGVPGGEAHARIEELLHVVGLQGSGRKMVGTFSSGMKQRLLIARALLARPRVLLLDEPTRSLDPISARQLRQFLREEIVGRQRCTVLLATHSAEEAFDLCDRAAILEHGRLLACGRIRDLMGEVSDDRYELEVREDDAAAALRLVAGLGHEAEAVPDAAVSGWRVLRAYLPGGPDGAAQLVSRLALEGIGLARFHRIDLTLADLIERIVERRAEANDA